VVDRVSKERRSWNMSRIRGRDTQPELLVRSVLHRMGFRFRLHARDLPGRPDIVLPKWQRIIFVHGCFWHRHPGCAQAYEAKSRKRFWRQKFEGNATRDRRVCAKLRRMGWKVSIIWECQTKKEATLKRKVSAIVSRLQHQ
jgi:DNA mismatch endonuclease (patch repair protein)